MLGLFPAQRGRAGSALFSRVAIKFLCHDPLDPTILRNFHSNQVFMRNACRDGSLDLVARLQLLEIIELRAMKWKPNENLTNYYQKKMSQVAGFGHKVPADYVTRYSTPRNFSAQIAASSELRFVQGTVPLIPCLFKTFKSRILAFMVIFIHNLAKLNIFLKGD